MSSWFWSTLTTLSLCLLCIVVLGTGVCCTKHVRHDIYMERYGPELDLHRSVARVSATPAPGKTAVRYASTWAVTPDLLYTAGHFCNNVTRGIEAGEYANNLLIEAPNKYGVLTNTFESDHFVSHIGLDMCIITAKNHGLTPLKLHQNYELIRTGDVLLNVGFPDGAAFMTYEEGRMGAISKQTFYSSIHVEPGASGSPVLWQSNVVGMVIKKREEPHNCSIMISVLELQKFLDDYRRK